MSDGQGSTWWRPSRLDDIHATPDRVLTLFRHYRMGQIAREHPFDWWRPAGTREFAHLYPASFEGVPVLPARCNQPVPEGDMERTGGQHQCPRCHAIAEPRSREAAPGTLRFVPEME